MMHAKYSYTVVGLYTGYVSYFGARIIQGLCRIVIM